MRTKTIGFALSALLLALCFPAEAQQPKKVSRIGYLSNTEPASESGRSEAIRLALRELGYVEGQNIAIQYRYAELKLDRLPELAAELVRLKVDIIVAAGGTVTVPGGQDCDQYDSYRYDGWWGRSCQGWAVESLARPGGNVTGLTTLSTDLGGKRLELLKEAVPKVTRVAVLNDPATPSNAVELKDVLPVAARALGLTFKPWDVTRRGWFRAGIRCHQQGGPDGLYVLTSALMGANRKQTAGFALKSRLPSCIPGKASVEAGGLMSYAADLVESYRRVGYYVDRILKGAKPADLPVEQPTKFELVINLKTARQIGLTIPQSLLYRADKVIK